MSTPNEYVWKELGQDGHAIVMTHDERSKAATNPFPLPVVQHRPVMGYRQRRRGQASPDYRFREGREPGGEAGEPSDTYTRRVGDWSGTPYAQCGKVLVSGNGWAGHGSGCLIAPGVVLTAAHVVADNPARVMYQPAAWFTRAGAPSKGYPCVRYTYSRLYDQGGSTNFAADVAVCLIDPSEPMPGVTWGWHGWDFRGGELPPFVQSIGYPARPEFGIPFNGNELWEAKGQPRESDSTGIISMPCQMTNGCSGGPWVYDTKGEPGGNVYSVNSHVRDLKDPTMYGPDLRFELPRFWGAILKWISDYNVSQGKPAGDLSPWVEPQ